MLARPLLALVVMLLGAVVAVMPAAAQEGSGETAEKLTQIKADVATAIKERDPADFDVNDWIKWGVMGLLVGPLVGMVLTGRKSGFGMLGNVLLGMIGTFIGSVAVAVAIREQQLGALTIPYDELIAAVICTAILVLGFRFGVRKLRKKTGAAHAEAG